ncbi:MAG: GAF domain-containing protein [Elusimicrobia bacterium]|nr:GAF domain-containing protein [Candidatus Liberimonas magnetica]
MNNKYLQVSKYIGISLAIGVFIYALFFVGKANPHSIPWFLSFIFNAFLCIFVYLNNRFNKVNRIFTIFNLCGTLWILGAFILHIAPSERFAYNYTRFFSIGMIFIPPTFLHFVIILTQSKNLTLKKALNIAYIFAVILYVLSLNGLFVKEFTWIGWKYYPQPYIVYKFYIINFVFWMIFSLLHVFRSYKNAKSYKIKNQLKYFFLAISVGTFFGSMNLLTSFGFKIYPIGGFANIITPAILAYAIVKHQLLDIQVIIRKSAIYGTLTISLIGIYALIVGGLTAVFGVVGHSGSWFINGIAGLSIAVLFLPMREKIQLVIDKLFFKVRYDYHQTLSNLSAELTSIIRLENLLELLVTQVVETMQVQKGFIMLFDRQKEVFSTISQLGMDKEAILNFSIDKNDKFISFLAKNKKIVYLDEIQDSFVVPLKQLTMSLCVPLITKGNLVGILNLGYRLSEDQYTKEDIELLTTISNQAAIAVENAQLHRQIMDTEKDLLSSDKFSALDTFAANIAHEIKNPLTSIKTFCQLLYDKFNDKLFVEKFNSIIPKEIERLENVLENMLHFNKTLNVSFGKVDIKQVLEELIGLLYYEIYKQNIALKKQYPETSLEVKGNAEQLKQVFMNLILNSIQAMPKGGSLSISIKELMEDKNNTQFIEVSVTDTGCGIPKESLNKLFKPFYTTKPKGTGLGLSITRKIVREHEGTISVESIPNSGTTFIVKLPVYQ